MKVQRRSFFFADTGIELPLIYGFVHLAQPSDARGHTKSKPPALLLSQATLIPASSAAPPLSRT